MSAAVERGPGRGSAGGGGRWEGTGGGGVGAAAAPPVQPAPAHTRPRGHREHLPLLPSLLRARRGGVGGHPAVLPERPPRSQRPALAAPGPAVLSYVAASAGERERARERAARPRGWGRAQRRPPPPPPPPLCVCGGGPPRREGDLRGAPSDDQRRGALEAVRGGA